VDVTVKPLYGRQEGARIVYNPHKPGRPSHTYHSYIIANTRLVLKVDVQPGDQSHASHTPLTYANSCNVCRRAVSRRLFGGIVSGATIR
jgi:hypothetical protein